jgi:hypothetical protein
MIGVRSTHIVEPTGEFVSHVAVNVLSNVLRQSLDGLKSASSWLASITREYDPFGIAIRRYGENLQARYGKIRIFGMSEPIPLRDLFVRVNILPKALAHYRLSADDMQELFDWQTRRVERALETVDALELVDKAARADVEAAGGEHIRQLIVLGKPGAGKTTLLKFIMLKALAGGFTKSRIPVLIPLKDWSDSGRSLLDFIIAQFDICGFPNADDFVARLLEKGGVLILLDGLDEIMRNTEETVTQIRDFAFRYRKNQFIISCRVAAFEYVFDQFDEVEIADFTDEQIDAFVTGWFSADNVKQRLCRSELRQAKNTPIRELCRTPLLLTMLCVAFDEVMEFPTSRAQLYSEAADALLKRWDTSRSIKRVDVYRRLSVRHKQDMLSGIAYNAFELRRYFFRQTWIEQQVESYLSNLPGYGDADDSVDISAIVKSIEAQHGLLVERAQHVYSFSHLTIQEYFAARYVAIADATELARVTGKHMLDPGWREVFLLCVEMLSSADAVLMAMRESVASVAASTPGLPEFIGSLESAVREDAPCPRHICKVVVLSEIDDQYYRAFGGAVGEHAIEIVNQLGYDVESYSKVFGLHKAGQYKAWQLTLRDVCMSIAVDPDRNISQEAMLKYIRGTRLIVDCLRVDAYVTRPVREWLLESILTEPPVAPPARVVPA